MTCETTNRVVEQVQLSWKIILYRLKISKLYDTDVDSCYNYINDNLKNPKAANNLITEIINKLNIISENPKIRPLVRDEYLANLGYRLINMMGEN